METQSRTKQIALDDGASTTLEQWGERGPVMLCVHGMTSSRRSWVRFAKRYAGRFRVLAYDQRGHGDSAGVQGPMVLERAVRDLENVAQAIGGADILVGHSWGGAAVIRGGLRLPVRAVIGIDPMIVQVDDEWYAEYVEELDETFKLTGAERDAATRQEYAEWSADDVEGKVHAVHTMTSAPIAGLRDENRNGEWDLREEIARYDKPLLLVMAGPSGSIVPSAVTEEVKRNHSPHVRIETMADQGHNLFRTDFEGFAAIVDTFLKDQRLDTP
jgi:pimeloyl-ACP methyl ester carboxylesterase